MSKTQDPAILFAKPGAINPDDKSNLFSAGIIVVEIDDPASVKLVRAGTELSGGHLLRAAAAAISRTSVTETRQLFGKLVADAILQDSEPKAP